MRAMVLEEIAQPLVLRDVPKPVPGPEELLIRVHACGVCRTDLHIADGELPDPTLPLILGHQIVGTVVAIGDKVSKHKTGSRVGVPWLGGTCHTCDYCLSDRENLCDHARFTWRLC
jgi:propanol-preferring alcohol dehydrogenase